MYIYIYIQLYDSVYIYIYTHQNSIYVHCNSVLGKSETGNVATVGSERQDNPIRTSVQPLSSEYATEKTNVDGSGL